MKFILLIFLGQGIESVPTDNCDITKKEIINKLNKQELGNLISAQLTFVCLSRTKNN